MEKSLKKHELASFHIRPNYRAQVTGLNMYNEEVNLNATRSAKMGAQNARIVSASPFKAVIEIGTNRGPNEFR